MEVSNKLTKDLIPYEKNAKKHPKKQVDAVARSIETFGFNQPIVVDTDNVVIVGHGRLAAAKQLNLKEVPVLTVDLPEEKAMAYRLADNKLNESDWEMQAVIEELKEIDLAGLDLTLTGFERDLIIEPEEKDDEVPELPEEPTSKPGDIYQLGEHRLMCGSATELGDVEKLFGGNNPYVELVFTDPPYGMDLDTDYSKMGSSKTKYTPIIGDQDEFDMKPVMELIDTKKWYIWGADYLYKTIEDYGLGNLIVWSKRQSEVENKVFGSAFELCWVYPKQKKEVWFVRGINQSAERLGAHPTQKPTELASRAITRDTEEGESVYDAFGGSGSTLIAAEKLNRKCYMMELDPKYVDVIIKRWEDYTGLKAEKVA